ncbi:hypothetical protein T02_4444 [Trichinella nativa]|uniref:C2H2-type domain-containing protein n=1 Tax=Trichinella nativa TaxID=6335 RepID=A0A0V1KM13_9BILA|nr:hypothetical protein T02_4444 [Trichinella nativa]
MAAIRVNYPGPFVCQTCKFTETDFARFVNHCTHHALKVNLACSLCGKHFTLINAVASHFPHCKKGTKREGTPIDAPTNMEMHDSTNNTHVCTVCSRAFNSFLGLRLHEKRAHPATFAATSKKFIKHQWTFDHLSEAKEVEDQLSASNSCSVKSFAEALSSKWSEAISMDMAKYLRKKLRRVDLNLNVHNVGMIDGDTSGFLPEVVGKSISLERVGSKRRATRIEEEINGVGVLSTCDTSGFRVETVG